MNGGDITLPQIESARSQFLDCTCEETQKNYLNALKKSKLSDDEVKRELLDTAGKIPDLLFDDLAVAFDNLSSKKSRTKPQKSSWFDKGGKFLPTRLADHLIENHNFIFDRGQLFYFNIEKGAFDPHADIFTKGLVRDILSEDYRDSRGEEIVKQIVTVKTLRRQSLDADFLLINFKNGILNWRAKTFFDHSPEALLSIQIPNFYNPNSRCPRIQKFLCEVFPADSIPMIFELIGYLLIHDNRFEKVFLLVGEGANGKSTFLRLLRALLGAENVAAESLHDLAENRFRVANLAGKLANFFPDLESRALRSTGLFKALVSGDVVSAEKKGCNPFDFSNKARLVFSCNSIPRASDCSLAFYRRLVIVRFPRTFSDDADPGLIEKLTSQDELSGLINLALEHLPLLMESKRFSIPSSSLLELEKYKGDNEHIRRFIESECSLNSAFEINKNDLFTAYCHWCADNLIRPFPKITFGRQLRENCSSISDDRSGNLDRVRVWRGINLNKEAQSRFYGDYDGGDE